jgi:uncharacterized membrane protein YjjP (DUF1212 family)
MADFADPVDLGNILLRVGASLLHAGASSTRVVKNVRRIADAFGYNVHFDLGTRVISITLDDRNIEGHVFTGSRSAPSMPGADFKVISAISKLSWQVIEKPMTLEELRDEYEKAVKTVPYRRIVVLGLVGLSGASFCYTFGGDWADMAITFLATVSGLLIRQELQRMKYNPYLVTFCSAAWATLTVCVFSVITGTPLDHAFATSILFLIPGVPLIVAFIDMIDGYIINGLDRGVHASIHAFAIATGLATMLYIFNIH